MRRREFITLLGGAAAAWPPAARAQQSAIPLVGYFSGRSSDSEELLLSSVRKGLEEEGFTIGKNIAVEYRFSDGNEDRLPGYSGRFRPPPDGRHRRDRGRHLGRDGRGRSVLGGLIVGLAWQYL
jgi:hypothetical protein